MSRRAPVSRRLKIFVCGEPARGDDAAGLAAVELLAPAVRRRVDVVVTGQLDVLLLLDLPADEPCIVVDAVAGLPPGEIWVRPLADLVDRAHALAQGGRAPHPASSRRLPAPRRGQPLAAARSAP